MNISDRKILETKRKIINLIRNREHTAALKVFYKFFSDNNPADPDFIESFYLELNRLNMFEIGFRMLAETAAWHPDNETISELRKNSAKLYFDSLILLGNNLLFEREEKAARFADSLKRSDSMAREKMREENDKVLKAITEKALNSFLKAYELNEDSLAALSGLSRCYSILGNEDKFNEIEQLLIEKSPTTRLKEKVEELLGDGSDTSDQEYSKDFVPKEYDIEEFNLIEIKNLFDQQKYADLIKRVDFLHLSHKISVPMLLIKARALVELRRFKQSELVIMEAEKQNSHFKEIVATKTEINEIKYRILTQASSTYLKKGLEIGPSLGKAHFQKAQKSLKMALDIIPENVDLLDSLYTAQKYLGDDKSAFKTRAMIYSLNSKFVTTFDRESVSPMCFIASFAFKNEPHVVNDFRWFRREFLLGSNLGRKLNQVYVIYSQKLLDNIAPLPLSAKISRLILSPMHCTIKLLKILFNSSS